MDVRTMAVVGAGQMGAGIAQVAAQSGLEVLLIDLNPDLAERGLAGIRSQLEKAVGKGKLKAEEAQSTLARLRLCPLEDARFAQFAVEAVTENEDVKKRVFEGLAKAMPQDAILATNTSSIPITRIAASVVNPERVIGMHFMNPVPVKKFVEMIRGEHTAEQTIETATALVKQLGKDYVLVKDAPGFVSNRVMMLAVNECAFVVQEEVATPADVDKVFRQAFGHSMGPLATADLIGIDTVLNSIMVLFEEYRDSKYRPCPLLQKMVDAGDLGRKSGRGFFKYTR